MPGFINEVLLHPVSGGDRRFDWFPQNGRHCRICGKRRKAGLLEQAAPEGESGRVINTRICLDCAKELVSSECRLAEALRAGKAEPADN